MSYFSELYTEIKYPIATEHSAGLRNAQIGAIHAIASHSTLEPLDAAVIVMPTGSGKTTVLMAYSFDKGVRPALERLLSWSYESSEGYQYSFIVNKQYINFPGKEDIACFEPTYAIEDFYKNMLRSLGKESVICKTILNFLLSHNYLYSYDEKCCINFFPEKYAL